MAENLYIIGYGVIAKALAVALANAGRKVTILRGTIDGEPPYPEHLQLETGVAAFGAEITISTLGNHRALDGIILLTNKSFGNKELAEKLAGKNAMDTPIVFLQNGLNIEESFLKLGFSKLYRCVLLATSQPAGEQKVRFRAVAPSPIGVVKGSFEELTDIVGQLHTEIFSFRPEKDIQPIIWKKVISNCVFNSICPLLEADNGVFHREEAAQELAKTVISECMEVAKANDIQLTSEEVLQNILSISRAADGQKISTYQDILNKRETEIDTLNFEMARAAARAGNIQVPVTKILGEMIKLKSDLSRTGNK